MDLRETTSYLLRAHDAAAWLRRADNYIHAYNKLPTDFVLPADHAILRPIIEAFATDTQAFAEYLRAMRDGSTGVSFDEIHALYRTVGLRSLQVIRRTRTRRAVMLLLEDLQHVLGSELNYDAQIRIAKVLEQIWGSERMALLSRERSRMTSKKLTSEDRAVLLNAFWKDIDNKLERGEVPLFGRTVSDIAQEINT